MLDYCFVAVCSSGYFGLHCADICPTGSYGDKCGGTCLPHCNNITCHHVYGCLEIITEKSHSKASGKKKPAHVCFIV